MVDSKDGVGLKNRGEDSLGNKDNVGPKANLQVYYSREASQGHRGEDYRDP